VLLPDTKSTKSRFYGRRTYPLKISKKAPLVWQHRSIPVTVSLGVATLHSGDESGDDVISRADEALYRAKNEGKNRTCVEKSGLDDLLNSPRIRLKDSAQTLFSFPSW